MRIKRNPKQIANKLAKNLNLYLKYASASGEADPKSSRSHTSAQNKVRIERARALTAFDASGDLPNNLFSDVKISTIQQCTSTKKLQR